MTKGVLAVGRYLLREDDEVVVDEVRRHWVVYVLPVLELLVAFVLMFFGTFVIEPADPGGWLVLFGLGLALHATWGILRERRECFVVTNMRVFRLHGVLSTHRATMPLNRILDITVDKPVLGRILGYGHLTFESAAQAPGLREVRFVGRADDRDLKIQRVVHVVGLRGPRDLR